MFISRPAFTQAAPIRNPMKPEPVDDSPSRCGRMWHSWPRTCTHPAGHDGECRLRLDVVTGFPWWLGLVLALAVVVAVIWIATT